MKVKLLTSRSCVRKVVRDEWEWVEHDDGSMEHVLAPKEVDEGYSQNVGDVIDVDKDEAERLIADGQAELAEAKPRARKAQAKPKAEKAEAKPKAEKAKK